MTAVGKLTQYADDLAGETPAPHRNQILVHDVWYPCERCTDLWPKSELKREPQTGALVCVNDYDLPSLPDYDPRKRRSRHNMKFCDMLRLIDGRR